MRRYFAFLVVLAFLLFALGMMAQTSSAQHGATTTTTTTTTTQATTTTGPQHTIEGCLAKEGSDFFLIPAKGSPIELQASTGENLGEHEGHEVKVSGVESSLSASSAAGNTGGTAGTATTTTTTNASGTQTSSGAVSSPAGQSASSNSGAPSGTGNDLHSLATKQMTVSKLQHIAASCPMNWNPAVPSRGKVSKY